MKHSVPGGRRSIFITGGAAGIGAETARLFHREGYFVGIADRDEVGLRGLERALGDRVSTHVMDVTDADSVAEALRDFTAKTGGMLHVLHNNAGILRVGRFETIAIEEHARTVDINVKGAIHVLHAAFPYLRVTAGAHVINMSSASAAYGTPDFASYSATKHAIRALTEALDIEWGEYGIRVSDLMPPFVNTGMLSTQRSKLIDRLGVNLGPDDVAREVLRLVESPTIHRPLTLQFRALWSVSRATPAAVTRTLLKMLSGR